ncbi:hypothetical protein ACP4OV_006873 [Aristida adscensionis]
MEPESGRSSGPPPPPAAAAADNKELGPPIPKKRERGAGGRVRIRR